MNVRYKKDASGAFMILEGSAECEEYAAKMLQGNRIRGVMPLTIHQVNGVNEYYFDISCGRSMSAVLEKRPITMSEVRSFLHALAGIADQMEQYLMNIGHLLLEPGMICLPMESRRGVAGYEHMEADFGRAVFCCHPAVEKDFLSQVRDLIQYFLNKMDHMEEQGMEKAYELFRISQKEYFRIEEMIEVCDSEDVPMDCHLTKDTNADTEESSAEGAASLCGRDGEKSGLSEVQTAGNGKTMRSAVVGIAAMIGGMLLCLWDLWNRMILRTDPAGPGRYVFWVGIALLIAGCGAVLLAGSEAKHSDCAIVYGRNNGAEHLEREGGLSG